MVHGDQGQLGNWMPVFDDTETVKTGKKLSELFKKCNFDGFGRTCVTKLQLVEICK